MLQMARASEHFLETPVFPAAATLLHDAPTQRVDPSAPASGPIDNARFIPGDLVAGRYRIVGLLGRGGMGEVYRADDLSLSQPVALKFLAESLARDGASLARFHREVSVARRISHRHVCRVYDIGEHAGMQFLSMEYIRGEELASLLKRIGRLPHDKAVDVARQLCAGLAAIHDAGVLHRDLKPANIMIDEHGDVRITDFGIVALSEGVSGREAMIGTPAYMSPEQLTGGELTTRSDLYSLGLVIHECFTGRRRTDTASRPSSTVPEVDAGIERVIARCLDPDPAKRPATALQVAAALPGGDPLLAALAAGETPSPQMVAASSKEGSLRPAVAGLLLVWIVAALTLVTFLSKWTMLHQLVPLGRSPELLRETAAKLARDSGYTAVRDTASGFALDSSLLDAMKAGVPVPILFWYRQSPQPLVAADYWMISPYDPPATTSGMAQLVLDPSGRLLSFEGVPPQVDRPRNGTMDWTPFFTAAGLDPARFRRIESQWTPPQHSDSRIAWSGVHPARSDMPLRIEAAAFRGQPTYFDIIGPWRTPERQDVPRQSQTGLTIAMVALYFGALALGAVLAWKNVRLGRGDRRGAFRLVLLTFSLRMLTWLINAHHVATIGEMMAFIIAIQSALYWSCSLGLLYLALEPFVRRRWPEWMISWSRLLAGDVRDPLVGRDVLIGGALGAAVVLTNQGYSLIPQLLGRPAEPLLGSPLLYDLGLAGARGFVALLVNQISAAFLFAFIILSVLLFFALVTRHRKVAIGITWLILYLSASMTSGTPSFLSPILGVVLPTLLLLALTRYGMLALVSMIFFLHFSVFYPGTTNLAAWYATPFLLESLVLLAVTLYGVRTSLAGQRMVGAGLFDE
jgi:serine/threonine protein kinase